MHKIATIDESPRDEVAPRHPQGDQHLSERPRVVLECQGPHILQKGTLWLALLDVLRDVIENPPSPVCILEPLRLALGGPRLAREPSRVHVHLRRLGRPRLVRVLVQDLRGVGGLEENLARPLLVAAEATFHTRPQAHQIQSNLRGVQTRAVRPQANDGAGGAAWPRRPSRVLLEGLWPRDEPMPRRPGHWGCRRVAGRRAPLALLPLRRWGRLGNGRALPHAGRQALAAAPRGPAAGRALAGPIRQDLRVPASVEHGGGSSAAGRAAASFRTGLGPLSDTEPALRAARRDGAHDGVRSGNATPRHGAPGRRSMDGRFASTGARGVGTPWPRTPASLPPWQCWDGCGTPHHESSKAGGSRPRNPPFGSGNERARVGHEKGKCHFKRGATHSLDPARHRRSLVVLGQRRMCALWVGLHPWPLSIPDGARPLVPGRFVSGLR